MSQRGITNKQYPRLCIVCLLFYTDERRTQVVIIGDTQSWNIVSFRSTMKDRLIHYNAKRPILQVWFKHSTNYGIDAMLPIFTIRPVTYISYGIRSIDPLVVPPTYYSVLHYRELADWLTLVPYHTRYTARFRSTIFFFCVCENTANRKWL